MAIKFQANVWRVVMFLAVLVAVVLDSGAGDSWG